MPNRAFTNGVAQTDSVRRVATAPSTVWGDSPHDVLSHHAIATDSDWHGRCGRMPRTVASVTRLVCDWKEVSKLKVKKFGLGSIAIIGSAIVMAATIASAP